MVLGPYEHSDTWHKTRTARMLNLMSELTWETVSNSSNSDASLLEELERLYQLDDDGDDQSDDQEGERRDREHGRPLESEEGRGRFSSGSSLTSSTTTTATSSAKEGPRQKRLRKHRESMARLRQERRNRIKALEKQEQTLHHKLHRALRWMAIHRVGHEANACRHLAYSDLVEAAESLLTQKYALEDELRQRERFAKLLAGEIARLDEESGILGCCPSAATSAQSVRKQTRALAIPSRARAGEQAPAVPAAGSETPQGWWMRFLEDEAPFFYDPEPPEACAAAIEQGLRTLVLARRSILCGDNSVLTAHCLGWKTESVIVRQPQPTDNQRSASGSVSTVVPVLASVSTNVPESVLHFRFTRRVSRLRTSLDELLERTWAIHQSADDTARLYGSGVVAKYVQKVSEDSFILLRNLPLRERPRQSQREHQLEDYPGRQPRFFNLITRMRAADGDSSVFVMAVMRKQPRQVELESMHCREGSEDLDADAAMHDDEAGEYSSDRVERAGEAEWEGGGHERVEDGRGDGDEDEDEDEEEDVEWLRYGVASLQFSHAPSGDDAIEIEYMGTIECADHDEAANLVIESCATLMRWEHLVVPPRLLVLE